MNNFYCNECEYNTSKKSDCIKHINCAKHLRHGKNKSTNCDLCDYKSSNCWNLTIHKLYHHLTKEDREKQKYYCNICDNVFVCKKYMDKNYNVKNHNIKLKVKESLDDIEKIINL